MKENTNLIEKFIDSIDEISKHPLVDVSTQEVDFFDEYDKDYLEQEAEVFYNDFGYHIPTEIKELASFPSRPLTVSWRYVKSNAPHQIAGGFSIREVGDCLSLEKNQYKIVNEDIEEKTQALMRKSHYFDVQPDVAWELATLLVDNKDGKFPDLWYLEYQKMYKMDIDLKTYLKMLLLTKGILHWQFFFVNMNQYPDTMRLQKSNLTRILEYLPKLFPSQDYNPLEKRFNFIYGQDQ